MAQIGVRRETRLLLVTIAVSVGMLLLLARFRFPERVDREAAAETPAAPLERLAARATYDELASIMADLERRLAPALLVVPVRGDATESGYLPAVRFTADRAVALLAADERVADDPRSAAATIIGRDSARGLAVLQVAASPQNVVTPRSGTGRLGPRYVAVIEATAQGPAIRPIYVGRTDLFQDPRTGDSMLSIAAAQQTLSRGAAVFSLDGLLIGLVSDDAGTIFPGDRLQELVDAAAPAPRERSDLGLDVQPLSPTLARATRADGGVIVAHVDPSGASAGHLQTTDVIQAIDDTRTTTVAAFQQVAESRSPDAAVRIAIIRSGVPQTVTVTARAAGTAPPPADGPGAVLATIADGGTEVVTADPRGAAARAGLQRGDLIVALNGSGAPAAAAVERAFGELAPGQALLLTVQRGPHYRVVALEKP